MDAQRITMVTLAVRDLERSREFYRALGWQEAEGGNEKIAFFNAIGQLFSLYTRDALTEDLCMPIHGRSTGTVTLATNYESKGAVDSFYEVARSAGAIVICEPKDVFWGGYSGYFADPDGHLWEIAYNPFLTYADDGSVMFE